MPDCKDKILKAAREKFQVTYQGTPIILTEEFSGEILQVRENGMTYLEC
jgi:hypothetical protein